MPTDDADAGSAAASTGSRPDTRLLSRIVVAWVELTLVGFVGAALASATSGPPRFVVFFGTTLLTVGVLFYNLDRHVTARLAASDGG
ncbi:MULTISPECIES: hypothetical protein [Haloplanus]|uniref:hypothetical protein n=1 Tax=Haloplanus TaxID=376170 RepID=UPI0020420D76|nr:MULTISPECIES: hypothetical protein [Haloplanus]